MSEDSFEEISNAQQVEDGNQSSSDSPKFHGSGGELFGIWIVNIIFSILTLGIYTAWAKVRVRKYFAVMTSFRGERLDYHASAWPILKGRIIAFVLFSAYVTAGTFSPFLAIVVLVALMLIFPFLILKSFQFNAANTSYRNIRFKLVMPPKTQWTSYFLAILPIIATIITLSFMIDPQALQMKDPALRPAISMPTYFLLGFNFLYSFLYFTPFFMNWLYKNLYNNLYFGNVKVRFATSMGAIYKKILLPYYAFLFAIILCVIVASQLGSTIALILIPFLYIGFLVLSIIFPYLVQMYIWNNLETNIGSTKCDLPLVPFILKSIGLTMAMGLSLGFAYPWVRIHFLKFFYSHRHLDLSSLDNIAQVDPSSVGATADEIGDAFDFDFDIGL